MAVTHGLTMANPILFVLIFFAGLNYLGSVLFALHATEHAVKGRVDEAAAIKKQADFYRYGCYTFLVFAWLAVTVERVIALIAGYK